MRILFLLLITMFLLGCQKENKVLIDTELQPYFDLFVEEAAARNITVDYEDLGFEAKLSDIEADQVAGQCSTRADGSRLIVIDPAIWRSYNEKKKEFLIFHELGHCYLDRRHSDLMDRNGDCLSIMHSSEDSCNIIFTTAQRSIYLDELFTN